MYLQLFFRPINDCWPIQHPSNGRSEFFPEFFKLLDARSISDNEVIFAPERVKGHIDSIKFPLPMIDEDYVKLKDISLEVNLERNYRSR